MNFSLLRHLVLKEIRYQRLRLILIWLLAYLLPLTNFFQEHRFSSLVDSFKMALIIIFGIAILLTWVSSIFLDPTFGSDRFLTTRPVKWTQLLASKTLFVLLFLWLPFVIFRLEIAWTTSVRLSFLDQAIYVFESTLFFFAAASLIVVPALFFRRLTTLLLFIGGTVFSVYVLLTFGLEIWETFNLDNFFDLSRPFEPYDPDPQHTVSLIVSRFLITCVVLALMIVPVAILRYWKSSVAIPLTVAFAGFFMALVYASFWSYPLDHLISDAPGLPGELPSPLRNQIHFTLESSSWDISRNWNDNSEYANKTREFHLNQKLHFDGITRPLFLYGEGSFVQVTPTSGKRFYNRAGNAYSADPRYDWIDDYLRKVCCGLTPLNPLYENSDMIQRFIFLGHNDQSHGHDILDSELPGATILGQSSLGIARLRILNVMPFKVGARQDLKRKCYEIRQIVSSEKSIEVLVNCSAVPLILRGDARIPQYPSQRYDPFVIINRKTGEMLVSKNDFEGFNPLDGLTLQWWTLTRNRPEGTPITEPSPSFPSNWLDDADICFFDVEPLGKISFPFSATVTNVIPPAPEKAH